MATNGVSYFEPTGLEETIFRVLCWINLIILMCGPLVINNLYPLNPYLMTSVCLAHVYTLLKLYSYHEVNAWWRSGEMYGRKMASMPNLGKMQANIERYVLKELSLPNYDENIEDEGEIKELADNNNNHHHNNNEYGLVLYPQNLTIKNIAYFSVVPTLCYQINYPRTKHINYMFVLRCLLEAVKKIAHLLICWIFIDLFIHLFLSLYNISSIIQILLFELITVLAEQWVVVPLQTQKFMLSQLTISQFVLKWTKLSVILGFFFSFYFFIY